MLSVRLLQIMAQLAWSLIGFRCRKLLPSPFGTMQALRNLQISSLPRFWYLYVRVDLDCNFMLKALLIKLYNSRFNQRTVHQVFMTSEVIEESHFLLFEPRQALWKASYRRELHQDYQWQVKFSRYVFGNTDRYWAEMSRNGVFYAEM